VPLPARTDACDVGRLPTLTGFSDPWLGHAEEEVV
jgi:hypothetical protein